MSCIARINVQQTGSYRAKPARDRDRPILVFFAIALTGLCGPVFGQEELEVELRVEFFADVEREDIDEFVRRLGLEEDRQDSGDYVSVVRVPAIAAAQYRTIILESNLVTDAEFLPSWVALPQSGLTVDRPSQLLDSAELWSIVSSRAVKPDLSLADLYESLEDALTQTMSFPAEDERQSIASIESSIRSADIVFDPYPLKLPVVNYLDKVFAPPETDIVESEELVPELAQSLAYGRLLDLSEALGSVPAVIQGRCVPHIHGRELWGFIETFYRSMDQPAVANELVFDDNFVRYVVKNLRGFATGDSNEWEILNITLLLLPTLDSNGRRQIQYVVSAESASKAGNSRPKDTAFAPIDVENNDRVTTHMTRLTEDIVDFIENREAKDR